MENLIKSLGSDHVTEDLLSTDYLNDPFIPDSEDDTLEILQSDDPDLTKVIEVYWKDIHTEIKESPVLKLYVAALYKLAKEYTRMEEQIENMSTSISDLGVSPALTNERARLRDNITSVTTEGWKLLNAVLDSLSKIQGMIGKLKDKGEGKDLFESFLEGDSKK